MCKKKQSKQNNVVNKPINEMTDTEFITNADYLSSPYYRAYVTARTRAAADPRGTSRTNYGYVNGGYYNNGYYNSPSYAPAPAPAPARAKKQEEDYFDNRIFDEDVAYAKQSKAAAPRQQAQAAPVSGELPRNRRIKKRGFFLFLIALLTLVLIFMAVTYFIDVEEINAYASLYTIPSNSETEPDVYITMADPIIGMFKCLNIDLDMESEFYSRYLEGRVEDNIVMTAISLYATPIAALLVVFFALIGFIKALVALFSGKKSDGYYKKIGFGFLSIAIFICGAIMLIGGMYSAQVEFSNFPGYLTFDCGFIQMGYGLYAILGISVLTFIFSCVSYKKGKKTR